MDLETQHGISLQFFHNWWQLCKCLRSFGLGIWESTQPTNVASRHFKRLPVLGSQPSGVLQISGSLGGLLLATHGKDLAHLCYRYRFLTSPTRQPGSACAAIAAFALFDNKHSNSSANCGTSRPFMRRPEPFLRRRTRLVRHFCYGSGVEGQTEILYHT